MHNQKAAKTAMLTELVNIAIRTSNRRPAFNRRLRLLSPPQREGPGVRTPRAVVQCPVEADSDAVAAT